MKHPIFLILAVLFALAMIVPTAGHEPVAYAEDFYAVGLHQASTQQLCTGHGIDGEGTVIHALTAGATGVYTFSLGHVNEWYSGTISLSPWEGSLEGDTLQWWPNAVGDRIVVLWSGSPCLIALPMITEVSPQIKHPLLLSFAEQLRR